MMPNYPSGVSDADFDSPVSVTLTLDDILIRPIEVCGLMLDGRVDVVLLRKSGQRTEVDSLHVEQTYLFVPSLHEFVRLDMNEFRDSKLYKAYLAAIEKHALKLAETAPSYEWEPVEPMEPTFDLEK